LAQEVELMSYESKAPRTSGNSPSTLVTASSSTPEEKPEKQRRELLRPGSIASSAFTLAKATLGAGALALPAAFHDTGIPLSVFLLVAMGYVTTLSIDMIVRAQHITGINSLEELATHFFGSRFGLLFEVSMIIFCFGTAVVYLISVADILQPMVEHWSGVSDVWYTGRGFFQLVLATVLLLPMSLADKINDVRYLTFTGVICILFLVISVVYILLKKGMALDLSSQEARVWSPVDCSAVIAAMSSYVFAYCSQPNVAQIYFELTPRSELRMSYVTRITVLLGVLTYVVVGITGYLAFGEDVDSSIINNMTPYFLDGDVVVTLSFFLMAFAILFAYPLNVFPTRWSVLSIIRRLKFGDKYYQDDGTPLPLPYWLPTLIVVVTVYASLVIAVYLPSVTKVLNFIGSSTGSMICFIVPAGCCLKIIRSSEKEKYSQYKWLPYWVYYTVFVLGWVFLFVGTYMATVDIVLYYDNKK